METADLKKAFPKLTHRFADGDLEFLTTLVREREVPAGSTLIEDGASVDAVFLVADGEFRVEIPRFDGAFEIGRIERGKWIGEIPLFSDDHTSTSRIVAITPSRVLELQHARFWSAQADHPDLVSALTREFVDHMSERARSLDELATHCLKAMPQKATGEES